MTKTRFIDRAGSFVAKLFSAKAVAAAVEAEAAPRRSDLDRLGIDPRAFRSIRLP